MAGIQHFSVVFFKPASAHGLERSAATLEVRHSPGMNEIRAFINLERFHFLTSPIQIDQVLTSEFSVQSEGK